MLETILSNINSNLERIANHLESKNEGEINQKEDTKQPAPMPVAQPVVRNPIPTPIAQPIPTTMPTNIQAPQMPTPQVPVSQTVEGFTQEQLAVAMSNATAAGRHDIVQTIFSTFKVNALMEIKPENYNQVATMLREAGIQV